MEEPRDYYKFIQGLNIKYTDLLSWLADNDAANTMRYDLSDLEKMLEEIIPSSLVDDIHRNYAYDEATQFYCSATRTEPWLCAIWHLKKIIIVVKAILHSEGYLQITSGEKPTRLMPQYQYIMGNGILELVLQRISARTTPLFNSADHFINRYYHSVFLEEFNTEMKRLQLLLSSKSEA